ncbi:MAG: hypothetical protein R6V26_04430 [Roseovarius sp.]
MSSLVKFAVLSTVLLVAGCAGSDRYPVSGEECGPDDQVKTTDGRVVDCIPGV